MAKRNSSRERILDAASELAKQEGSAHVSLDAIAAHAGISKGGLLYNFPSKAHLLRALVERYVDEFGEALGSESEQQRTPLASRYLELAAEALERQPPPSSGLLAALAENPELLEPVRQFNRALLDRLKAEAGDDAAVLTLFLMLEGLRSLKAFGTDTLTDEERALAFRRLRDMAAAGERRTGAG